MTEETLASRINRLTETVRKAGRGDFSGDIHSSGLNDELDMLGYAISQLVNKVREQAVNCSMAEDAGRLWEEKYRRLKAIIPGMVYQFALHPDGSFSFPSVNEASRQLFDLEPEALMADASLSSGLIHPDDRERFAVSVKKSAETMQPWREVLRHIVHGEVRWYDCMSRPEPQPNGDILWDGIILEITDRKRTEESLKQSERKYRDIFENAPVGIFRSTLEGKFIDVNPVVARMLKYDSPEEMVRMVNHTSIAEAIYVDPSHRRELIGAVSSRGGWQIFEEHFRCKDGSIIVCNFHFRVVPGQADSPREFEGFVEDISERTLAEEMLKKSEERMRLYFERQLVGMAITSPGKGWLQVNDRLCLMLGYGSDELVRLTWEELTHPDDLVADLVCFERLLRGEINDYSLEKRFIRKDGATVYANLSVGCVRAESGSVEYLLALLEDISERKQVEKALRESENRYRLIVETAEEGIWQVDREWKTTYVNQRMEQMLGCRRGEMLGRPITDFMDDEGRQAAQELVSRREEGIRELHDFRFVRRDGSSIDVLLSTTSLKDEQGAFAGSIALVTDISDRKRAEEELKLSQFIIENASTGIMRGRGDGRIMVANKSAARMLGYSPEELCSLSFFDIDPTLTPELWLKHRNKLGATGSNTFETLHRRKDGTTFPVEVAVNALKYQDQEISCSFTTDISKRKRAEDALRESEEKFRVLAETSPTAIALIQGERFVYVNEATVRLTGCAEEELMGMQFWELTHADFREMVRNIGLARQRGEQVPKQYQSKIITRGGEERWVAVSGAAMDFEGKPAGIVTFMDVTEAKLSEERIQAALVEKEVLLKEIHHRVKNNLQIVSSLLDLQSESIRDQDALRSFRESQNRIAAMALVHEQLYQTRNFSSIDFHGYIEGLTRNLFRTYVMDPDRVSLVVDAGNVSLGIDQAIPCGLIVNELVSNALKYAFPGDRHGTIRIGFQSEENGWIRLTIADNGVGLPAGTDFIATETLGLQLVRMLVRQLKGEISLDTSQGASFHIRFQAINYVEPD
ncbi:MAG: PAS domain S-box protein [Desulfuromonadales bacterium]|nr:PAS domain S-box protein [Desulfuromonadales bacterium]